MFPSELTLYPQWVCWRLELDDKGKPTKVPYNARTGFKASHSDPATWTDYNTAANAASNGGGYTGIGFVLSIDDPYVIIDLDNPEGNPAIVERQTKIAAAFNATYQEISPSGNGLHIIGRGKVFAGRKRNKVEIYSSLRFFTMTGATFNDAPIVDVNQLANMLWDELGDNAGGNNLDLKIISHPEKYTDEIIYNCASQANNGDKFLDLWQGTWRKHYSSQSEADLALINIIGFYSRNVTQIRRLFLQSALGQRDKAKRKAYVDYMIGKSFDNLPPLIDLDTAILHAAEGLAQKRKEALASANANLKINPWRGGLFENQPDPDYDYTKPPGLLGEISDYIYSSAMYPVKEVALGYAIGLMSGICGRAYNIKQPTSTGLNNYVLVIAKTGIGKEAGKQGIEKLIHAVRPEVPAISEFIGPSDISSGQALIRHLSKQPCFVSMVGEFGLKLEGMHNAMANPAQQTLKRKMLEIYMSSGHEDVLRETVYADKSNNTDVVKSPAFSLLGDATPQTFFRNVDDSMISEGLIPRFLIIEYTGNRPEPNDAAATVKPSQELISKLATLSANSLTLAKHSKVIEVKFNPEAEALHKKYRNEYNFHINSSDQVVTRELWNRAHLKVLKLSALIGIGESPFSPVVNCEAIEWARRIVESDIVNILSKFESGKAGKEAGELNQINELVNCISNYMKRDYTNFKSYRVDQRMHTDGVIPLSYIQRRLINTNAFKNDKIGATNAITKGLRSLADDGSLREVRAADLLTKYQTTMKAFFIADQSRF